MRELSEQEIVRRGKIADIRNVCNPYPERYEVNYSLKEAKDIEDGTKNIRVAGRISLMRKMGKLSFVRIRDLEGDMQLEIKIDCVGEENYAFFKKQIDTGDFIGATGEILANTEVTIRFISYWGILQWLKLNIITQIFLKK